MIFTTTLLAYLATAFISIAPNIFLFFIPERSMIGPNSSGLNFQNVLLCFASGGLLGDVFIHTLPHLQNPHDHHHGHENVHNMHSHSNAEDHHQGHLHVHSIEHNHDHDDDHHEHETTHSNVGEHHHNDDHHHQHDSHALEHDNHHDDHHDHSKCTKHDHPHDGHDAASIYEQVGLDRESLIPLVLLMGFLVFLSAEKFASRYLSHNNHDHKKNDDHKEELVKEEARGFLWSLQNKLQAAGWLNLLADSMHNFTDGIALGASFASGSGLALPTFLSVILHEIPHEIGDFTILMQSGFSKFEAIRAQFLTAIAAMVGTAVGLYAQRNKTAEDLLLAFTSGGFLYIATVSMLPSIMAEKNSPLYQAVLEILAFTFGVGMMLLVALFE